MAMLHNTSTIQAESRSLQSAGTLQSQLAFEITAVLGETN
jgi:hypothetical protein